MSTLQRHTRTHAADHVFEQVALAIVNGDYPSGGKLPSERVIADQCGTSRIIVRQAIHRLADFGLVEVRQGGGTTVLDIGQVDIRLFEVLHRIRGLLEPDHQFARDLMEHSMLYCIGLLDCAHRRASSEQRQDLLALVGPLDGDSSRTELRQLERDFWSALTQYGGNRVFRMEMAWWERVSGDVLLQAASAVEDPFSVEEEQAFYHQLAWMLARHIDPIPFYLSTIRALLGQDSSNLVTK